MKKIVSFLMTLLTVCSLFTVFTVTSFAASSVVPSGAKEYNGHTYYVYKGNYTWSKAKSICEKKGGHLVTITSAKENKFVKGLVDKANITYAWLGASDSSKEGTWKWVTGETFSYTSWASYEPDTYYDYLDYMATYSVHDQWGSWGNDDTRIQGFVCEWDTTKAKASAPKLNKSSVTIYNGKDTQLYFLNSSKTVKWSTSDKTIATVSSKGVVKGVGLGTATISAKVGSKTYKCKVKVKQRDLSAKTSFKVTDGGYFILGEAQARVAVKVDSKYCAKAYVRIVNSDGETVYKKILTNLKKGVATSFNWNGKDSKGNYVPAGSYRLKVTIGSKNSYSSWLSIKKKGDFADGNGSKANPFKVATVKQFKKIGKYANAYFVQTNNLNFNYTAVGNFFSADNPFNGVYNGNGKTISNISSTYPIFNSIGAKGQVKNVKFVSCTVKTKYGGIIANTNYGKIANCTTSKCIVNSSNDDTGSDNGMLLGTNYGYVSNCIIGGSVTSPGEYCRTGGIAGHNAAEGKIISCVSNADVIHYYYVSSTGGIVGTNSGLVSDCEATGAVTANVYYNNYTGGITGRNYGQIVESYYTGSSAINTAGENTGTIM